MQMPRLARRSILVLLIIAVASIGLVGCEDSALQADKKTQEEILLDAQSSVPPYRTDNFLARKAINEYMERLDVAEKEWYIYLVSDAGTFFGYYIMRTYPLSIGVGMTNPQRTIGNGGTIAAPGIDGVFWAGADPTTTYGFTAVSDAIMQWNVKYIMCDQPLNIDAPLIQVINVPVQ